MKTYRSWAELDDWGSGRQFRTPHKRKSKLEWQSEIQEEMAEEEMQEVFPERLNGTQNMGKNIYLVMHKGELFVLENDNGIKLPSRSHWCFCMYGNT